MKSFCLLQILLLACNLLHVVLAHSDEIHGGEMISGTGNECETFSNYPLVLGENKAHMMVRSTETTITFVMKYTRKAWLGIGFSKSGLMVGPRNIAIIGSPDNGVAKYLLKGTAPNDIVYMDSAEQTLVDTAFTQSSSEGSELTFTRYLEDGENPDDYIMANGKIKLIWAVGGTNDLLGHRHSGSIDINIDPCQIFDASGAIVSNSVGTSTARNILKAHGILATIVIGALMPIGVLTSAARKWLGICWKREEVFDRKTWFFLHASLMGTSAILFLALFILAIIGKSQGSAKTVHFETMHEIMGLLLFILVMVQSIIATIFRPSPTTSTSISSDATAISASTKQLDPAYNDIAGVEENNPGSRGKDSAVKGTKSAARKFWEAKHTIGGFVIISLGCYELKSGLDLYSAHYGEVKGLGGLLYGWIAFVAALLLTAAFQIYSRKKAQ